MWIGLWLIVVVAQFCVKHQTQLPGSKRNENMYNQAGEQIKPPEFNFFRNLVIHTLHAYNKLVKIS